MAENFVFSGLVWLVAALVCTYVKIRAVKDNFGVELLFVCPDIFLGGRKSVRV